MRKQRFNTDWLNKIDSNGNLVHKWCMQKDDYTATCTLCHKDINVEHMGLSVVKHHNEKKVHF